MHLYKWFYTHFFAFAIAVKLIFSVDDAHLSPRSVFLRVMLHPVLLETLFFFLKTKSNPDNMVLVNFPTFQNVTSLPASAGPCFLFQRFHTTRKDRWVFVSGRHFEITAKGKVDVGENASLCSPTIGVSLLKRSLSHVGYVSGVFSWYLWEKSGV